ncbi:MAG TPA: hypothetical protein VLD37_06110 [Candidatus Bilamarchaeum sp.]|nr:hypothetical protein [Candidatus Bilamarchaeum sp.]
MAQRQRKQPQERTIDDLTRETRDIAGRLNNVARPGSPGDSMQNQAVRRLEQEYSRYRNMTPEERERAKITPEQMERLQRAHDDLVNRIKDIQNPHAGPTPGQRAAPQRIFNYDVIIGSGPDARTFRVTLHDRLPPGRESQMLLEMARNHEFFEPSRGTVDVPNSPAPRAEVTQLSGPRTTEFNNGPQMARVDNFEVALNQAREATPPTAVMVVAVSPQPQTQTRPRGG